MTVVHITDLNWGVLCADTDRNMRHMPAAPEPSVTKPSCLKEMPIAHICGLLLLRGGLVLDCIFP